MYMVITLSEDRELAAVAVGTTETEAARLAAEHIMREQRPAWPDIRTVFEAGVHEQVIALWNANRHQAPVNLEYRVVDVGEAMDDLAARLDARADAESGPR